MIQEYLCDLSAHHEQSPTFLSPHIPLHLECYFYHLLPDFGEFWITVHRLYFPFFQSFPFANEAKTGG